MTYYNFLFIFINRFASLSKKEQIKRLKEQNLLDIMYDLLYDEEDYDIFIENLNTLLRKKVF